MFDSNVNLWYIGKDLQRKKRDFLMAFYCTDRCLVDQFFSSLIFLADMLN